MPLSDPGFLCSSLLRRSFHFSFNELFFDCAALMRPKYGHLSVAVLSNINITLGAYIYNNGSLSTQVIIVI